MRAMVMHRLGGPDVLRIEDLVAPEPGAGEVRIDVRSVAVMRTRDVETRAGRHPFSRFVDPPHVLGGEHAGVIDAVGPGVPDSLVGRRVAVSSTICCGACRGCSRGHQEACAQLQLLGIHRPGAYAERTIAPVENVHSVPAELPWSVAACMAAVGPVAHAQLAAAGVGEGTWVAVPGANGMLGLTITALAAARGARVVGLVRRADVADAVTRMGAAAVLDGCDPRLAAALLDVSGGVGMEAVIDNIATPELWEQCMQALAPLGRVVISGAIGGQALALEPRRHYLRSQSIIGVRTGNRADIAEFWQAVRGGFQLPQDIVQVFPLDAVPQVHEGLESGDISGHVALAIHAGAPTSARASAVARV